MCLTERLAHYHSLSPRWRSDDGELSTHARQVLASLEPVFVRRLADLAIAGEDEVAALMLGLPSGRFDEKWGALPVALWLTAESCGDDRRLSKGIEAGPWGVVELARLHLPDSLAGSLPSRPDSGPGR